MYSSALPNSCVKFFDNALFNFSNFIPGLSPAKMSKPYKLYFNQPFKKLEFYVKNSNKSEKFPYNKLVINWQL